MGLEDRVIVVTGASAGLGNVMAEAFVAAGARVVCAARTEDRLTGAVDALPDGPGAAIGVPTDVRSWPDVRTLVDRAEESFGPVDVLVNNAALRQWTVTGEVPDPVGDIDPSVWETVVDTNLRGYFLCAKAVLPGMLDRDAGRLVHMSSGYGRSGYANSAPYVASKFAVEGFAETLALELADTGVDSVVLYPPSGGVTTDYLVEHGSDPESFDHTDPSIIAEPALQLAAGAGEHGGRYMGTPDGEGFVEHPR